MNEIQVDTEVLFKGCFMAYIVIAIQGKTATVTSANGFETIKKRLSSLRLYRTPNTFISDEEAGQSVATFEEGSIAYSIMEADGHGGVFVWKNGDIVKS